MELTHDLGGVKGRVGVIEATLANGTQRTATAEEDPFQKHDPWPRSTGVQGGNVGPAFGPAAAHIGTPGKKKPRAPYNPHWNVDQTLSNELMY